MRLLYTLTSYPPSVGGAQIHTHLLAQAMAPNAVQVITHWSKNRTDWLLGTTLLQPPAKDYAIDGVSVHSLGFSVYEKIRILPWLPLYYPFMPQIIPQIASILESHILPFAHKVDVIHNIRMGRENLSYASLQVAHQINVPFVFTPVHHPRWVGWRYKAYLDLYRAADAVIAMTNSEKQKLVELSVAPERIHVTGVGPVLASSENGEQFRQKYALSGQIILFLGQHYPYKGYCQLLQAMPIIWQRFPEAHAVFIGPSVKSSEQVFAQYSDSRILRLGAVDIQAKTDALAACDLLCVPSTQESFGGIYTEAWSFKKPVIGCNIPAVADVISDGVDGYLTEQKPESIAEKIIYLLANPAKAAELGEAGKIKVETQYSWSKIAEQTYRVYQSVCLGS